MCNCSKCNNFEAARINAPAPSQRLITKSLGRKSLNMLGFNSADFSNKLVSFGTNSRQMVEPEKRANKFQNRYR